MTLHESHRRSLKQANSNMRAARTYMERARERLIETICEAIDEDQPPGIPSASYGDVAKELGLSKQRVHELVAPEMARRAQNKNV